MTTRERVDGESVLDRGLVVFLSERRLMESLS